VRIVPIADDAPAIDLSNEQVAALITQILTAVAVTYENEPSPPDNMARILPAKSPWVAPLKMSYSRQTEPPLLNFDFGGLSLHLGVDRDTVGHVLAKFVEATRK
jgi:hypothetical protein